MVHFTRVLKELQADKMWNKMPLSVTLLKAFSRELIFQFIKDQMGPILNKVLSRGQMISIYLVFNVSKYWS